MEKETRDAVVSHLEYLGYTLSGETDRLWFSHTRYYHFSMIEGVGGLLIRAGFGERRMDADSEIQVLRRTNIINTATLVGIACVDPKGGLWFTAWYPLPYGKSSFAAFMDAWHSDALHMANANLGEFLPPPAANTSASAVTSSVAET